MRDYWRESVEIALDEAGVTATDEQIEEIAGAIEISHENYGMAMGHDVASVNLAGERERETERLKSEIERERAKITCRECNGSGWQTTHGPIHNCTSQCWKCRGAGRHDP